MVEHGDIDGLEAQLMSRAEWLKEVKELQPGDICQWRPPARTDWRPGTVVKNGGSYYWTVRDEGGNEHHALHIEYIRPADGRDYWEEEI